MIHDNFTPAFIVRSALVAVLLVGVALSVGTVFLVFWLSRKKERGSGQERAGDAEKGSLRRVPTSEAIQTEPPLRRFDEPGDNPFRKQAGIPFWVWWLVGLGGLIGMLFSLIALAYFLVA
jgi:hypothetical protein